MKPPQPTSGKFKLNCSFCMEESKIKIEYYPDTDVTHNCPKCNKPMVHIFSQASLYIEYGYGMAMNYRCSKNDEWYKERKMKRY